MKVTKDATIKIIDKIFCDKCGEEIKLKNHFDAFNCCIELRTGEQYPEGGFVEIKTIDLCEDCAEALFRILGKHGYRIRKRVSD